MKYELEITKLCNNCCTTCTNKNFQNKKHKNLNKIKEEISNINKDKYNTIIVKGGEPTIHPNFFKILELIKNMNFKINLKTNAILFSQESFIKEISNYNLTEITIKIISTTKETYQKISQSTNFLYSIKGIKNLSNLINQKNTNKNFKPKINLDININKENINDLYKTIYQFSKIINIDTINIYKTPKISISKYMREIMKLHTYLSSQKIPITYNSTNESIEEYDINLGFICNNSCKFCMSIYEGQKQKFTDYKTIEEKINSFNPKTTKITLLGGEPTIHPNLIDIIKYLKNKKFLPIHIVSNGRKFSNYEFTKEILTKNIGHISISIHSHIKKTEDYLCQKNAFDEKIQGIKNILTLNNKLNLNLSITTNTVINTQNYKTIKDTITYLNNLGINNFHINFIYSRAEEGIKTSRELQPQYTQIMPYIKTIFDIKNIKITLQDFPLCILEQHLEKETFNNIFESYKNKTNRYTTKESQNITKSISYNEFDKIKISKCQNCKYNNYCEGILKDYIINHSSNEFE